MKKSGVIGVVLGLMLLANAAVSQTLNPLYESIFIYQISKNIQWGSLPNVFVIEVLGKTPIIEELNKMAAKKRIQDKEIIIKIISDLSESNQPSMLFVSEKMSKHFRQNKQKLKSNNTLVVTEKMGMARDSCINLILVNGKLKFEVNTINLDKNNLKISRSLKTLAQKVI